MVLHEDTECSVCYMPYSRQERVPRVLHCDHTFCGACLELMAKPKDSLLTVCCPLCRRITCVDGAMGLQTSLWVDTNLWEQICNNEEEEEFNADENKEEPDKQMEHSPKEEMPSTQSSRPKLKLPAFLRKLNFNKQQQQQQQQETVFPSSNIVLKSWRKLSPEEMIYRD